MDNIVKINTYLTDIRNRPTWPRSRRRGGPRPRSGVEGPGQRRYQPLRCAVSCRRYPGRDIAFLLGITPQRVSQIGLKDDDD